jgi:hypothetical protein
LILPVFYVGGYVDDDSRPILLSGRKAWHLRPPNIGFTLTTPPSRHHRIKSTYIRAVCQITGKEDVDDVLKLLGGLVSDAAA